MDSFQPSQKTSSQLKLKKNKNQFQQFQLRFARTGLVVDDHHWLHPNIEEGQEQRTTDEGETILNEICFYRYFPLLCLFWNSYICSEKISFSYRQFFRRWTKGGPWGTNKKIPQKKWRPSNDIKGLLLLFHKGSINLYWTWNIWW